MEKKKNVTKKTANKKVETKKKTTTKKVETKKKPITKKETVKKEEIKIVKPETEVEKTGAVIAAVSMVIVSFIYFTLCIVLQGKTNYGWYSMISLYCTVVFGYKAIKLHKKIDIATSIIWLLMFIITAVGYVMNIIDTSGIL